MKLDAIDRAIETSKPRTTDINNGSVEIELSKIYANPDQPRKNFDPVSLSELAESINTHGLMQPISVVRKSDGYMIIAGERRYRACKLNGSITIKANILEREDHTVEELALIENIQREDLTDYEIAMAIVRLWESGKYAQKQELAKAIQKPLSYISKAFGLLKLDPAIRADIEENNRGIGLSVLEELSRVDPSIQVDTYQRYKAGEITRDDFKTAAKPKAEKISRGKKEKLTTIQLYGSNPAFKYFIGYESTPTKKYKITIEEIG